MALVNCVRFHYLVKSLLSNLFIYFLDEPLAHGPAFEREPTQVEWERFKNYFRSLYEGNDAEDSKKLTDFLIQMTTKHRVSVTTVDLMYKFFLDFCENMVRLKAKKKLKRSFRHMRLKRIQKTPLVLTDVLKIDSNGEESEDEGLRVVFRHPDIVRQVNRISLEDIKDYVFSHPKHNVAGEEVLTELLFCYLLLFLVFTGSLVRGGPQL